MLSNNFLARLINFRIIILAAFSLPLSVHATFIESSIGTAVVNDATAVYYNPAALTLVKQPQLIALGSIARFRSHFKGQFTQISTHLTQAGTSSSSTYYYLPAFYAALPANDHITLGLAVISNLFNRGIDEDSILRYVQSSNNVRNIDFVPGFGFRLNDVFAMGAGVNISFANMLMRPISGFPNLDIPDNESRNECGGAAVGADMGFLWRPIQSMIVGFNYRTPMTYHLSGNSIYEGNPQITSNHYRFVFWTPARSVLSVNQFITPRLGVMGTIQRIQWSIIKNVDIYGVATQVGATPSIVDTTVKYHLHDAWLLTLGGHYRVSPPWVVRVAASYNQSPGNPNYQITTGDSVIVGISMGYEATKKISIDASYAHAFIKNQAIHITTSRNIIDGMNDAVRDAVSLKLTFNL